MKYYKNETTGEVFGYDETDETQLPFMQVAIDKGYTDVTDSWPPAPVLVTPTSVTMRQARLALFQQGLLAKVQAAVDGMADPQKTITQISWDYAQTVNRDDDLVVQLSAVLGLDSVALDALFTLGAGL